MLDDDKAKRDAKELFERVASGRPLLEFSVEASQLTLVEGTEGALAVDCAVFRTPFGETGKLRLHFARDALAKLRDFLSEDQRGACDGAASH